jgi:hypothetical protein
VGRRLGRQTTPCRSGYATTTLRRLGSSKASTERRSLTDASCGSRLALGSPRQESGWCSMTDWERIWRGSGVVFVVLVIVAFFIYGDQPKLGASPAELLSFFHGDRIRILIATVIFCLVERPGPAMASGRPTVPMHSSRRSSCSRGSRCSAGFSPCGVAPLRARPSGWLFPRRSLDRGAWCCTSASPIAAVCGPGRYAAPLFRRNARFDRAADGNCGPGICVFCLRGVDVDV